MFVSFRRPLYVKDRTYGTGTVPDGNTHELVQCYASSVMNFLDSTGVQDGPDITVSNRTTSSQNTRRTLHWSGKLVDDSYFTPAMSVYISFENKGVKGILVHTYWSSYIIFRRCQLNREGESHGEDSLFTHPRQSHSGKCVRIVHSHMFIPPWKADSHTDIRCL